MSTPDLAGHLAELNERFQQAPLGGQPSPGFYPMLVRGFEVFEMRRAPHHVFLRTLLEIEGGQWEGRVVATAHNLTDPDRLGWLKRHLLALGASTATPGFDLAEIRPGGEVLNGLLDRRVLVRLKGSRCGRFVNAHVERPLA